MKKLLIVSMLFSASFDISTALAADYKIDIEGMHAAINFKVKHVGISWLSGRFDKFDGSYTFDENDPSASKVTVDIDVSSVNSNHQKRDEHIQDIGYLNTKENPMAHFESTSIEVTSDDKGIVHGNLTLNGVTKPFDLHASFIGMGDDPWGGYRSAFEATAVIKPADFDYAFNYGDVYLEIFIEGVRQ